MYGGILIDILMVGVFLGYRPTGRLSSVRAPWEPPMKEPRYANDILGSDVDEGSDTRVTTPQRVDYWGGSAAQIAYGNCMNTFQCLSSESAEYKKVFERIITEVIPRYLTPFVRAGYSGTMNKLQLQHTVDNGLSQLEIEFVGQRSRKHPRGEYFRWPIVLGIGMNYHRNSL